MNDNTERDPRLLAIPDTHGHAKGEHKPYAEERPLPLTARMLFLWFYHACRRGYPRFLMVADHMNYLTFEDPAAVNLVRRALKLAQAGDLYGAAETANVDVGHAAVVSEGLRRGMRYSIGAEVDNDPRSRPDAQNIVDAMRPDAVIRSVHFVQITHPVHGEGWHWPFDNPEFADLFEVVGTETLWDAYIATLIDAVERLPGHIVGHFYVPAIFGHWPDDAKLESYEDRMLEAVGARGMAIEFNTRFLYRDHTDEEKQRYLTANKRLMRKARDRGVGISIGSDAHSPKDQGRAFETVLEVLDELDINEIVFPLGGMLRRVALRVVREPEPEPAPPPPPPPPEPVRAARAPEAAADAEPVKAVVRKARPAPKPARAPERADSAAATPPDEHNNGSAPAAAAAAPADDAPPPAAPKRAAKAASPPAASSNGAAEPVAAPAPAPVPPPAKPAKAAAAAKPAAKAAPAEAPPVPAKPAPAVKAVAPKAPSAKAAPVKAAPAKAPAKAPVKAVSAKPPVKAGKSAPVKPAAKAKPAARPAAKPAKAKPPARKAAAPKPAAKKAAPAKAGAKKASSKKPAPAKKAGAKKPVPKKAAPSRGPAKKAGPAKKPAAKKSAPARNAPARKPAAAKKTAKKTATKRR